MTPTKQEIEATINRLRALIEQAVRDEQLRHQLTGLPNGSALEERLQSAIEQGQRFWLAFVEIDRFKSINDRFGYDLADGLLREVARSLERDAPSFFAGQARAFHAHGDEFYLLGHHAPLEFDPDAIGGKLDSLRAGISQITLPAGTEARPMTCTVSIGWTENHGGRLRDYFGYVEAAVAFAKRQGRNRVARYDPSMTKLPTVSSRADCAACQAAFSFDVAAARVGSEDLYCPNCGERGARPATAGFPPSPVDITDR